MRHIALQACDRVLALECGDDETASLLTAVFSGLLEASAPPAGMPALLRIARSCPSGEYQVFDRTGAMQRFTDPGHLLFHVDKQVVLALQLGRPDLLFLHAGVVAFEGRAVILAAPAGTGKSTLALALAGQGFDYLSDELAPIDLNSVEVYPYRRALCLKSPPPVPCQLPPGTLVTGPRFHVPVDALPGMRHITPLPIAAFMFVRRETERDGSCEPMSPASAAAYLIANALNAGAHAFAGLEAAVALATAVPSFAIDSTNLAAACARVTNAVGRLEHV